MIHRQPRTAPHRPTTRGILLPAVLVAVAFAGCTGGEDPAAEARTDTDTFEIPGGGSIEYKLGVAKGGTVEYTWSAGRPLNYDFHGDTGGSDYTSYKKGTATSDSGSWTAPFEGRHGWWWQNTSSGRVSVTLTTEGTYDVVGLV